MIKKINNCKNTILIIVSIYISIQTDEIKKLTKQLEKLNKKR